MTYNSVYYIGHMSGKHVNKYELYSLAYEQFTYNHVIKDACIIEGMRDFYASNVFYLKHVNIGNNIFQHNRHFPARP